LFAVIAVLVTLEAVLRYAFNNPTDWSLELVIALCTYLYFLSGAYGHRYGLHVKTDIIYSRFTPRTKAAIDLFTFVLLFIFVSVLLWYGGDWFWFALREGKTTGSMWDPPLFPFRLVLPLGAFFLLLQGLGNFIRDFNKLLSARGRNEG
jgi:TRAP-type mannitol/chloroaromatic compound transport system permease small subunit